MLYGPRTFLELSVGNSHTVEIIINIRRSDLAWWNDEDGIKNREKDLFTLIERRILPQEFGKEIKEYHDEKNKKYTSNGSKQKGKKRSYDDAIVGEKNLKQMKNSKMKNKKNKKTKSQPGSGNTDGTKQKDNRNKQALTVKGKSNNSQERKYTSNLNVTFLFGEEIQVTYKVEEISTSNSVTILYSPSTDCSAYKSENIRDNATRASSTKKSGNRSKSVKANNNKITKLCNFVHLPKLSKRIILWVYTFDPANPIDPNPTDGGFPRPEMIPISSLFSEPEG